jgi:hypothetical protein
VHIVGIIVRIKINLRSQLLRGFQCADSHGTPNNGITFFLWACLALKLIQIGLKMYKTDKRNFICTLR